ncbi:MAG: UDP-N-acetylmuramoyl-L-alanine--D-glutamate ligase [Firmicutes bacterium]|nr:UDP-N-acetylmuramoyl-L-alanine--D-glutamate ligase [Bacillota bacterium]
MSGVAAAKALSLKGRQVVACDLKTRDELGTLVEELESLGVRVVTGGYPEVNRETTDLVVTSPGVPRTIPPLKQAEDLGIPVWGEVELAYRFSPAPFVGITGTNGKTTTTALLGQMLQDAGRQVLVGGNIGVPLVLAVESLTPQHLVVAEMSSFQLEGIHQFRPRVAAILNVTPDHLDRHHTVEEYAQVKSRIFMNQGPEDFAVFNHDCPVCRGMVDKTRGSVIRFSRLEQLDEGVMVRDGQVVIRWKGREDVVLRPEEIYIRGAHNLENAMAAIACATALGVPADSLARTLREFPGVAHRLERVAEIDGVLYINDSKGTNPDSTIKALESFTEPIVMIAGGKNKGSDFSQLAGLIRERVKCLVLLGQAAPDIHEAVARVGFKDIYRTSTFEEAVMKASSLAEPGDVVLLSPACASWDMFRNYEERGDLFKSLVGSIAEEKKV